MGRDTRIAVAVPLSCFDYVLADAGLIIHYPLFGGFVKYVFLFYLYYFLDVVFYVGDSWV
jgi:hypothetical protein